MRKQNQVDCVKKWKGRRERERERDIHTHKQNASSSRLLTQTGIWKSQSVGCPVSWFLSCLLVLPAAILVFLSFYLSFSIKNFSFLHRENRRAWVHPSKCKLHREWSSLIRNFSTLPMLLDSNHLFLRIILFIVRLTQILFT